MGYYPPPFTQIGVLFFVHCNNTEFHEQYVCHELVNKILNMFITCAWLMITNRILIIITIIRSSLESLNFDLEYLVKVILRYVYIYYILR